MKRFLINMCLGLAALLTSCEKETREVEAASLPTATTVVIHNISFAPSVPFNDQAVEYSGYRIMNGSNMVYQNLEVSFFFDEPSLEVTGEALTIILYDIEGGTMLIESDRFEVDLSATATGMNEYASSGGGYCGLFLTR